MAIVSKFIKPDSFPIRVLRSEGNRNSYHPYLVVIYILVTGPIDTAVFAMAKYTNISHIRSRELYISSILPAMTTLGIADAKPVMARPTRAAAGNGTAAMKTQNKLKNAVLIT